MKFKKDIANSKEEFIGNTSIGVLMDKCIICNNYLLGVDILKSEDGKIICIKCAGEIHFEFEHL